VADAGVGVGLAAHEGFFGGGVGELVVGGVCGGVGQCGV